MTTLTLGQRRMAPQAPTSNTGSPISESIVSTCIAFHYEELPLDFTVGPGAEREGKTATRLTFVHPTTHLGSFSLWLLSA